MPAPPVLLCADIDRGGVFASVVGTLELLEPEERAAIKGVVINKFRGDPALLTDGLSWLEERTGTPVVGVVNHFKDIHIPEEDSVALDLPVRTPGDAVLDIAVIQVPHISNFDDFEPLARENGVSLRYVSSPQQLACPDLVVLPGTKTTIPDLAWMEERGLGKAVGAAHRDGTAIIGICGGYQMLGTRLYDPEMVESANTEMQGLGILPLTTVFGGSKETHRIKGRVCRDEGMLTGAKGLPINGYEIHMGRTSSEGLDPAFIIDDRSDVKVDLGNSSDGVLDSTGWVLGTYVHGLFHNGGLRQALLQALARRKGANLSLAPEDLALDIEYDKLADWVRGSLRMDLVYQMAGLSKEFNGEETRV